MKKSDLVRLINEDITKISKIVDNDSFILVSHFGIYSSLVENGDIMKLQTCHLVKARNWLRDIQDTQMVEYKRIWAQKTLASWEMGKALGLDEANEYKALNRAIKELRKTLVKIGKPELFTRKIKKILKEATNAKSKTKTTTRKKVSSEAGNKDDDNRDSGRSE